eukprot:TRINITY_DN24701_c3_g1_i1.p1 TRINITY_DN24701_c3_g1~~TRINITY_DN24701_c3_g1_i1.p1  ORF type:complete len:1409 (+),score=163.27 TRINITY_DN24701_c3_g1_i1:68-4294(+)
MPPPGRPLGCLVAAAVLQHSGLAAAPLQAPASGKDGRRVASLLTSPSDEDVYTDTAPAEAAPAAPRAAPVEPPADAGGAPADRPAQPPAELTDEAPDEEGAARWTVTPTGAPTRGPSGVSYAAAPASAAESTPAEGPSPASAAPARRGAPAPASEEDGAAPEEAPEELPSVPSDAAPADAPPPLPQAANDEAAPEEAPAQHSAEPSSAAGAPAVSEHPDDTPFFAPEVFPAAPPRTVAASPEDSRLYPSAYEAPEEAPGEAPAPAAGAAGPTEGPRRAGATPAEPPEYASQAAPEEAPAEEPQQETPQASAAPAKAVTAPAQPPADPGPLNAPGDARDGAPEEAPMPAATAGPTAAPSTTPVVPTEAPTEAPGSSPPIAPITAPSAPPDAAAPTTAPSTAPDTAAPTTAPTEERGYPVLMGVTTAGVDAEQAAAAPLAVASAVAAALAVHFPSASDWRLEDVSAFRSGSWERVSLARRRRGRVLLQRPQDAAEGAVWLLLHAVVAAPTAAAGAAMLFTAASRAAGALAVALGAVAGKGRVDVVGVATDPAPGTSAPTRGGGAPAMPPPPPQPPPPNQPPFLAQSAAPLFPPTLTPTLRPFQARAPPPPPPPPPALLLVTEPPDDSGTSVILWLLAGAVVLVCGGGCALAAYRLRRRRGRQGNGELDGSESDTEGGGGQQANDHLRVKSPDDFGAASSPCSMQFTPSCGNPGASPTGASTQPQSARGRCPTAATQNGDRFPPADAAECKPAVSGLPTFQSFRGDACLSHLTCEAHNRLTSSQRTLASDGRARTFEDFEVNMLVTHDFRGPGVVVQTDPQMRVVWIEYQAGDRHHYKETSLAEGKIQPEGRSVPVAGSPQNGLAHSAGTPITPVSPAARTPLSPATPGARAPRPASPTVRTPRSPGPSSATCRARPDRKLVAGSLWFAASIGDRVQVQINAKEWLGGVVTGTRPLTVQADMDDEGQRWPHVGMHPDGTGGEIWVPGVDRAYWVRPETVTLNVRRPGGSGPVRWGVLADTADDLVLESVVPGSPLGQAGITAGMRVLRVGDAEVRSVDQLRGALDAAGPSFPVTLQCAQLQPLRLRRDDDGGITARGGSARGRSAARTHEIDLRTLPVSQQPADSHILWDDGSAWVLSMPPCDEPMERVYAGRAWVPAAACEYADVEPSPYSGSDDSSTYRSPYLRSPGARRFSDASGTPQSECLADTAAQLEQLGTAEADHRKWLSLWRRHFEARHGRGPLRDDVARDREAARVAREARQLRVRRAALELQQCAQTRRGSETPPGTASPSPRSDDVARLLTLRDQWRRDQGKQCDGDAVAATVARVVAAAGRAHPEQVSVQDLSEDSVADLLEQVRKLRVSARRCGGVATPARIAAAFPELHLLMEKAQRALCYAEVREKVVSGDEGNES